MNFTLYKIKVSLKKKLIKFWYWLMKPIAYFFTVEKEDVRYQKKKAKITKEQAIRRKLKKFRNGNVLITMLKL